MSFFDEHFVDQVRSANDIVDVISQYIPMKRAGRNFKALSPFKKEKTASFMVSPEKQIFHCFASGTGGDVIGFVMRYENITFPEAVRKLAERAHLPVPETSTGRPDAGRSDREKIIEAYQLAAQFYHQVFLHPEKGKAARAYYLSRGFSMDTAKEFQVGWATENWDELTRFLAKKGFSEEMLVKARLANKSPKNGRVYDLFRNRLLFPIQNAQGKIVAFGGRLIAEGDGPKYLNSPENPVFVKRRELFGFYQAKRHLDRDLPQIFVVEGYLDFLRLYEKGFKTAVATLGTALTDEHVALLKRYAQEVVVIYDGDSAGQEASLRGLEIFLAGGLNVKLVTLPEGEDPDDFLTKRKPEEFQKLIETAADFFDFKIKFLTKRFNPRDSAGVVKISQECLATLAKVENPVLLNFYLRKLSAVLQIREDDLRTQMKEMAAKNSLRRSRQNSESDLPSGLPVKRPAALPREEVILLDLMIGHKELRQMGFLHIAESDFSYPACGLLYRRLVVESENNPDILLAHLLARVEDEALRAALTEEAALMENDMDLQKAFTETLRTLKKNRLKDRLSELSRMIKTAEMEKRPEEIKAYMTEYQELMRHV